jgi:hypothetical protein
MGEKISGYNILEGGGGTRNHLRDEGVDMKIILKLILRT